MAFFGGGYNNQQQSGMPPAQSVDFSSFDTNTIKEHLATRGLSTTGDRNHLIQRLKEEVNKAWSNYYSAAPPPQYGGGYGQGQPMNNYNQQPMGQQTTGQPPKKKKKRKRKRSTMTDAERKAMEDERESRRVAKAERKAANKLKEQEARERKRERREEAAKRQKEMEGRQKLAKENRQRSEVFVYFDMKPFAEQLKSSLDPKGTNIQSCNYDFSHKGFRVRFSSPEQAAECSEGATMETPRTVTVPTSLQVLPAPVESCCFFFLDPCNPSHPEKDAAFEWVATKGVEATTSDLKTLNVWKQSCVETYLQYGSIVNVYRERGFIVTQFVDSYSCTAALQAVKGEETPALNGISLLFLSEGTPKKRDRIECDKKYPKPKKNKKKAETDNNDNATEATDKSAETNTTKPAAVAAETPTEIASEVKTE